MNYNLMKIAFNHPSLPVNTGLYEVRNESTGTITHFECQLCNVTFPRDRRNNVLNHFKSKIHQLHLTQYEIKITESSVSKNIESNEKMSLSEDGEFMSSFVDGDNMTNLLTGHTMTNTNHGDIISNVTSANTMSNQDDGENMSTIDPYAGRFNDLDGETISYNYSSDIVSNHDNGVIITHILETIKQIFNTNNELGGSNYLYYSEEFLNNKGRQAIIAKSIFNNHRLADLLTNNDVELHLALLQFCMTLTINQRIIFADLLMKISSTQNASIITPFVHSFNDLNQKYMKNLWENIPSVQVFAGMKGLSKKVNYATCSVHDCIAYFLASDGLLLNVTEMHPTMQSKYQNLKDIHSRSFPHRHEILFISLWSDSFDPNNTKQNRNKGIWILSLTIVSSKESSDSSSLNKHFPIGVCAANDSESQDMIIQKTISEINSLNDNPYSYYYKYERCVLVISPAIWCIIQDQPERRKRNYIMMGNSRPSIRWGYIASNLEEMKLPACQRCIDSLRNNDWYYLQDRSFCQSCYNWDSSKSLGTIRLNHTYLIAKVEEANKMCDDINYNYQQLKTFLSSAGLNDASSSIIHDRREKIMLKKNVIRKVESSSNEDRDTAVRLLKKMDTVEYEKWKGSPLWFSKTHDLDDVVDAPMHLLFLGIVKTTIHYIGLFLKQYRIGHTITSFMKNKMEKIANEYKLTWIVLLEFKPNADIFDVTGWVSENFVAYARIFLWYISSIKVFYEESNRRFEFKKNTKPTQFWKRKDLVQFMELHGIDYNRKSKTIDLIRTVDDYRQNPTTSTLVVEKIITASITDIVNVVKSMDALLKAIFGKQTTNTRNEIERYSRLFLSDLHKLCTMLGIDDIANRVWNCQSLLNLGHMHEKFGRISDLWEGGLSGEGIIKFFKREKQCLSNRNNWPSTILKRVIKKQSMSLLTASVSESNKNNTIKSKKVHVYGTRFELSSMLSSSMPISAVLDTLSNRYYATVRSQGELVARIMVLMTLTEVKADDIAKWYKVKIEVDEISYKSIDLLKDSCIGCLLLPIVHMKNEHESGGLYMVVSSDWL